MCVRSRGGRPERRISGCGCSCYRRAPSEAGLSTFYSGIHYQLDIDQGLSLGQAVAQVVVNSGGAALIQRHRAGQVIGIYSLSGVADYAVAPVQKGRVMFRNNLLKNDPETDGIDRRGFLKCMQWAGTAVVWSFAAACRSRGCSQPIRRRSASEDFAFVQISDSYEGSVRSRFGYTRQLTHKEWTAILAWLVIGCIG